jgi:hypothetical protein
MGHGSISAVAYVVRIWSLGANMASAEREPAWGSGVEPQWGPGAKPLVREFRGEAPRS